MPVSATPAMQKAECLASEVVGILLHDRADGRRLLDFAGHDPYPVMLPVVRAILRGTLDPELNRTPEITDRFAELGASSRSRLPDAADLMVVCGRTLFATEHHVARARPDLMHHDSWVRHWATVSQISARAAMFGHRRPVSESDAEWSSGLHDPRLPQVFGLRAPEPIRRPQSDVEMVREASKRVDAGDNAVIATDKSGTILYWNDIATSMYGWQSSEALGRNVVDVTPVIQARGEAEAIMRQLLRGRPWSGPFNVRTRAGAPLRAYVTDIPVQRDASVVGIVGLSAVV